MNRYSVFFINSIMLGVWFSLDCFSLSMINGMNELRINMREMFRVSGVFAFFQVFMFILGRICAYTVASYFTVFKLVIPHIAFVLLMYIGIKMLLDGMFISNEKKDVNLSLGTLLIQSIAASVDAFYAGFTFTAYKGASAVTALFITSVITFAACTAGLAVGKRFGKIPSYAAQILSGFFISISGLHVFIANII